MAQGRALVRKGKAEEGLSTVLTADAEAFLTGAVFATTAFFATDFFTAACFVGAFFTAAVFFSATFLTGVFLTAAVLAAVTVFNTVFFTGAFFTATVFLAAVFAGAATAFFTAGFFLAMAITFSFSVQIKIQQLFFLLLKPAKKLERIFQMGFNPSLTLRLSDIQSRASQKSCALFSDQSSRSSTEKDFLHPLQREARCRSAGSAGCK